MGGYFYGFCDGITQGKKGNDAIWVVVDRLTKSALFLPIKMTDSVDKLAKLYVRIPGKGITMYCLAYIECMLGSRVRGSSRMD
jgi:hypothetical protein